MARPSDTALILHTSGTTSRPKMVPLTHKNLTTSAVNIQRTLELRPNDLCLNIMPLFHIHGLVAAVLGTIASGGSIVCTPGFYVNSFFEWLTQFQPTWYTAVPTMHQAILNRAQTHLKAIQKHTLRFIRSSSASLPPAVMTEIEQTFGVPVIEAYGMTEASHQMASNPLPPAKRKPGSVGLPAGPEIAIMDELSSKILPKHTPGEIVIRGENVTLGYLNNPDANQKAYTDGWFRTGDQGYLDEEGYLIITGRIKEIINRGGEKISPREVDEVLLDHPAVSQAVTFGIPDLALGEAVGTAVVLKDKRVDESELKQYAAGKLSIHKVPSRILIMDEIPKGPTGKLQRIGLAEKLGLTGKIPNSTGKSFGFIAPRNELEEAISKIWQEILGIAQVGVRQSFRDVGGDSMLATLVHQELETQFGIQISLIVLMDAPDIESQAALVSSLLNQNSA
jgi:acyl-CoA synthetase (AMP-forming)/AMP-acid ligase II/acyl carrier protein